MIEGFVRIIEAVNARRRLALAVAAVVGLSSLPFAVLLFSNLRSQIEELLPRSAPSIQALDELHDRLGESMQLNILVSGAPLAAIHAFLDRLAADSYRLPSPPRFIDYRTDEVQAFFGPRKSLFIETADLLQVEKSIKARVAYEKRKANPFNLGLAGAEDEEPPELDIFFEKYKGKARDLRDYPSGFFDSMDKKSTTIIFYPAAKGTGYESARAFKNGIEELARRLAGEQGLAGLKLEFSGDVQQVIQEQESLQSDLLLSSVLVLLFEMLLLLGFYRWWPSVPALLFPLTIGTVVTFALGWLFIGSLNASSAFLGSIIVGNGINPGIILLSRFVEERRKGLASPLAMRTAVAGTLVATIVASLAAAIAYGALMVTTFRGYNHFGFMGGIGMVLCWFANFLLLPTLTLWFEERFPLKHLTGPRWIDALFHWLAGFNVRRAASVGILSLALTVCCLFFIAQVAPDPMENDTRKLRSTWAFQPGGYGEIADRIDDILQRVQTPAVILVKSDEDVKSLEKQYLELIKNGPKDMLMGQVFTIHSLVPEEQDKKIEIFARIRKQLSPSRLARLDDKTRELAERWLPKADLAPFTVKDLPEYVKRQFREKDGTEGKLVLLFPKHKTDTANGKIVRRFAKEIRQVPLPPGAWAAGSYLVFADMIESIVHDGPIATLVALIGVLVLTLLLARGARGSLVVTLSLIVGVVWTCGLGAWTGMRLNFLNFIALPITFGIGVDYATNVYGRFRLGAQTREELVKAVEFSGAAVAIASATTIIGYSSLLFSRNGALYSFGVLSVVGEIACLVSALVLLPAMVSWRLAPAREAMQPAPSVAPRASSEPPPPPA